MIETLGQEHEPGIAKTMALAFRDHPMMPPGMSAQRRQRMFTCMLRAFAKAADARFFGICCDGRIDCAAFVYDAAFEPRGWQLVVFLYQMLRILGWSMCRSFARVLSQTPARKGRPLELMLLGTRTEAQGQGFGRVMLRHIYEFAAEKGYDSVVLEVAKATPAFGFYLREGFVVDKEITLPMIQLCFLRRPLGE